jgi:hypothetical protein
MARRGHAWQVSLAGYRIALYDLQMVPTAEALYQPDPAACGDEPQVRRPPGVCRLRSVRHPA